MSSLADELLADLGDDEPEVKQEDQQDDSILLASNGSHKRKADDDADESSSARKKGKAKARFADDLEETNGNYSSFANDADLLDDEDQGDDDEDEDDDDEMDEDDEDSKKQLNLPSTAVKPAAEMEQEDVDALDLGPSAVRSVHAIATLSRSSKLRDTLEQIEKYAALETPDIEGILEESPEYQLIVSANNLAVDVDNEIMLVHKFIRDHYSPRFPELESLIRDPWDFVRAVRALGNSESMSKAHLEGILPNSIIVVISMTASTTTGQPVSDHAWKLIQEACDLVFELDAARVKILQYVESRMTFIAPNLSAVVGTRVATKLMGAAGGLQSLTKIPSCNLEVLGAARKAAPGMAQRFSNRHVGFIAQSDLVQGVSEEYRRQAQRKVAAKAVIAARMDALATSGSASDVARNGNYGRKLHADLDKALEKLQEPPPSKMVKALPVPKEGGRKQRRGGRRARKLKQLYGMTELRKMANRVEFGKEEEEASAFDESIGLGMINSSASGKIRAQTAETRTKAKMSKRNKDRVEMLKRASANRSGAESGTQTSLAFTPFQGIELVDPSRNAKKVEEANAKWFREGQFSIMPNAAKSSTTFAIPGGAASSKNGNMGPPAPKKEQ